MTAPTTTEIRAVSEIAGDIRRNWRPVHPWAEPYVQAMFEMMTVDSHYGLDSGRDVILRFLSNARTWKGPKAREIKAELKAMLK